MQAQIRGKQPNKAYVQQGWNAHRAGLTIADCPYYRSSTAGENWVKGFLKAEAVTPNTETASALPAA